MSVSPSSSCVVSVVIPAYNAEKFIIRAVQSVLNQQIVGCEILIVNDGSTDQTLAKLIQFSDNPQVRILSHPGGLNRSVCASRRLALSQAKGEFVAFLDSDDEYLPAKLERHISILRKHPQVVLVHGQIQRRIEDSEAIVRTTDPTILEHKEDTPWLFSLGDKPEIYDLTQKSYFLRRNFICNSSVVCRRAALNPDEDLPLQMIGGGEDWVLWNCMSFRGLFYYDPEPLTLYLDHQASFTHNLLSRAGAAELTAIEFYLSILTRLPNLRMRARALCGLIYHLMSLAQIRKSQLRKAGLASLFLRKIFEDLKGKTLRI